MTDRLPRLQPHQNAQGVPELLPFAAARRPGTIDSFRSVRGAGTVATGQWQAPSGRGSSSPAAYMPRGRPGVACRLRRRTGDAGGQGSSALMVAVAEVGVLKAAEHLVQPGPGLAEGLGAAGRAGAGVPAVGRGLGHVPLVQPAAQADEERQDSSSVLCPPP